jgi:hypothetical protein
LLLTKEFLSLSEKRLALLCHESLGFS